jgi:predicted Zn-ribbon and HTH transcriptional regulator
MAHITLDAYRCERCGHEWVPRAKGEEPKVCPKCKSPYWNTPRRITKKRKK